MLGIRRVLPSAHRFVWLVAPWLAIAGSVGAATAPPVPDPSPREGWTLELYLGLGPGALDRNEALQVEGEEHEVIPIERERGGCLGVVMDYALLPELSAGGELACWSQRADDRPGRMRLNLSLLTVPLTWYPGGGGLFVRGGPGLGLAQVDYYDRGIHRIGHDLGFGFQVAAGYAWRLTDRVSICPRASYGFFGAEKYGVWASFGGFALGCRWALGEGAATSNGS